MRDGTLRSQLGRQLFKAQLGLAVAVQQHFAVRLLLFELFFQRLDASFQAALLVGHQSSAAVDGGQLFLELVAVSFRRTAGPFGRCQLFMQLHQLGLERFHLLFTLLQLGDQLVAAGTGFFGVALELLHLDLELLELFKSVFFELVGHLQMGLQVAHVSFHLLAAGDGSGTLFPLVFQLGFKIAQLLDESAALLFALLFTGLKVPLELGFQGLHVDLQAEFGVFSQLKFIFQFLNLRLLFGQLRLQGAFGSFQLVDVLVGRSLGVGQVVQFALQLAADPL